MRMPDPQGQTPSEHLVEYEAVRLRILQEEKLRTPSPRNDSNQV